MEFQPGDLVLIKFNPEQIRFRGKKDKRLMRKYEGLVAIISKVGKTSYKVDTPSWMKMHPVFHVSQLKPYHADKLDPVRNVPSREEIPEPSRRRPAKEVEQILVERKVQGERRRGTEFLVKWKDLSAEETTWEKAKDLQQFVQKIEDFRASRTSEV